MSAVLKLVQGSAEWHTHRLTMRNASESAAVLGISPWVTLYQLWLLKTGRKTQPTIAAMAHGTAMEPAARTAYELQTGNVMQPLVMQDGDYSASLDGITLQGDLIVEIKCPMRGRSSSLWREVESGQIPGYYAAQIQHQMMVSGATTAHLWVFDGGQGLLRTLERDEAAMAAIREAWGGFQPFLDADTPPPLVEADTVQREDAAWAKAAQEYAQAKRVAQASDEALDRAKEALVALAEHPREQGCRRCGHTVLEGWERGLQEGGRAEGRGPGDLSRQGARRGASQHAWRMTEPASVCRGPAPPPGVLTAPRRPMCLQWAYGLMRSRRPSLETSLST